MEDKPEDSIGEEDLSMAEKTDWELFSSLPFELQKCVVAEADFPTLANVIPTCVHLASLADTFWGIACLRVYPKAVKPEGFSWRWVALSKELIPVQFLFQAYTIDGLISHCYYWQGA